ncbi:MAG: hypothetical protein ACR2M1_08380 [Gemmatimonadaceae bacterium]
MARPANPTPPEVPTRTGAAVDPSSHVTLTSYREHKGLSEETVAFDSSILLDGRKVGTALNTGRGGANIYDFVSRAAEARVTEIAKAWAQSAGDETSEVLDAFVNYLAIGAGDLTAARSLFRRAAKANTTIAGVVVVEKEPFFAWNDPSKISGFDVREYVAVTSLDDVTTIGAAKRLGAWRFHVLDGDILK